MIWHGPIVLLAIMLIGLPLGAVGEDATVIARTCLTCHHPDNKDIPALPGELNREALAARLNGFREPDETVTVMHRLMVGIDEEDIPALTRVLTERP